MTRRFLVRWSSNVVAVMIAEMLMFPNIKLPETGSSEYWSTLAGFAALLACLTLYVRPLVYKIMGPVTCLAMVATLGIAHFVSSIALFWLAGRFVDGVEIGGFTYVVQGAIIVGIVGVLGSLLLGGRRG